MIALLNEKFVNSWIIIDDVKKLLGAKHPELASVFLEQHQYPFDFFFLTPQGKVVKRLTSFQDLRGAHPDVGHPRREGDLSHIDVFLGAIREHFGG